MRSRPMPRALIGGDDRAGLGHRAGGVEGEVRVDLGRDAAGHDSGELGAETHREPVADRSVDGLGGA